MTENGNSTFGVDEDPRHDSLRSVGQVGGLDDVGDLPPAGAAPLPTRLEVEYIGQLDHSVPTAGQMLGGDLTPIQQAGHERP
jgi:hypothetical protein